jgi:hypothetical protein
MSDPMNGWACKALSNLALRLEQFGSDVKIDTEAIAAMVIHYLATKSAKVRAMMTQAFSHFKRNIFIEQSITGLFIPLRSNKGPSL